MIADSENGTFGATSAAADQTLTISAALHHAIEHHKAGRLPEAERLYRAILQADPRQPDAHHNLGQLARQVGQPRAALPHLKAALEAKPEVAQYWLSLIAALIECNEVQAARSLLDQARSRGLSGAALEALDARLNAVAPALPQSSAPPAAEPNAPAVHAAKYSAMGAAHALLQPAIDMRECGDYAGAEAWLRAHLAQQPEDVAALALLAQVLLLRKDDAQAAQVLQRAAGIDAQHPAVLRNQARLKLKQNAAQEALVLAEAAYAGEPTLESRLLRAAVLAAVQRGDEAAREIDAILAAKPDYAEAWANRALITLRTQKFEEAIAAAERAVAIKPHLAQVWQLLASLRMQHRHDLAGAIAALQKSLSIEPDDVARLADLGEFLRRAKRLDEALQVLQRAVSLDANSYAAWVNYGTALQEAERLDEAKAAYEKALAINPRSAEVANNLGAMAKDREDWEEALRYFEQALAVKPDHAEILSNKAAALAALERFDEAETTARACLRQHPEYLGAHLALASALSGQRRFDEARNEILTAENVQRRPLDADFRIANAWASFWMGRDDWQQAEEALRRALAHRPGDLKVLRSLAFVLDRQERYDEARPLLDQALEAKPDDGDTLQALAGHFARQERWEEGEERARQALALKPRDHKALRQLAGILDAQDKHDEARPLLDQALEAKPDDGDTLQALAGHFARQERWEEAERWAKRAIEKNPRLAYAYALLGQAYNSLCEMPSAIRAFAEAIRLKPKAAEYRLASALLLPSIMDSPAAIAQWRARYQEGIAALHGELDDIRDLSKVSPKFFYLAYHDADDRLIMESLCRLFRSKAPQLNYTAPHIAHWQMPQNRPIRIGFCSQFLCSHTIGKLYQGIIRGLDRQRFEVVLIYPPQAKRDAIRTALEQSADRVVALTGKLPQWQAQVAALEPDVFFYPDIGMSPATYFLAYARLAPVQVVSYGHPDTTGIDTLDYFLGGDPPLEATGAEAHYSERLIRCPRLPFCYQIFTVPKNIPSRAELGLPETGTLYGCPQSLFKLHPDFDAVLAEIAAGDPKGHIVLIDGQVKAWNDRLRQRWLKTSPILNERVRFVPRCSLDKFMALLAHFDVVLDPIHFGSGNTLYESMAYGKPIVTWPGRFARGRFVAAAYQQMGLTDVAPIAPSIETYAATALAFGRDAERRRAFTERALAVASRELYGDVQTVRLFETVVIAALQAAARGEKLPSGWRVPQEAASTGRTLGDAR